MQIENYYTMIHSIFLVGLGGAFGSIFRYLVGIWLKRFAQYGFPWPTFFVNIMGSLLIGMLICFFANKTSNNLHWQLLLATGLCGGFTTFSSFTLENIQLIQEGKITLALLYIAASLLFGLVAVALGMISTRWLLHLV